MTLEEIKIECRKAIELGQVATNGPWEATLRRKDTAFGSAFQVMQREGDSLWSINGQHWDSSEQDANHIAHARTFAPAAAKALLSSIEGHEEAAASNECLRRLPCIHCVAVNALSAICKSFKP